MQIISKEGINLPKLNGLYKEIEVIELKKGLYKVKSGRHSVNVSQKKLDNILEEANIQKTIPTDINQPLDNELESLIVKAKELGIKGNVSGMRKETLINKIKEKEGNA
jgi:hypothetical protein